jgi:hypothetical protein
VPPPQAVHLHGRVLARTESASSTFTFGFARCLGRPKGPGDDTEVPACELQLGSPRDEKSPEPSFEAFCCAGSFRVDSRGGPVKNPIPKWRRPCEGALSTLGCNAAVYRDNARVRAEAGGVTTRADAGRTTLPTDAKPLEPGALRGNARGGESHDPTLPLLFVLRAIKGRGRRRARSGWGRDRSRGRSSAKDASFPVDQPERVMELADTPADRDRGMISWYLGVRCRGARSEVTTAGAATAFWRMSGSRAAVVRDIYVVRAPSSARTSCSSARPCGISTGSLLGTWSSRAESGRLSSAFSGIPMNAFVRISSASSRSTPSGEPSFVRSKSSSRRACRMTILEMT